MTTNDGSLQPIDELQARVSAALRRLPGAVELHLYGSAADPERKDAYSDLDLQVVSEDLALSRAAFPQVLELAGEIALAFPLQPLVKSSLAFSVAFEGESPYHKIDIGLCGREEARAFLAAAGAQRLLWRQVPPAPSADLPPGDYLCPPEGSAAHFLLGEMLSAVRYVKSRRRSQHFTCWRFLSAKMNALLRCLAWDGDPGHFPQNPLSTWDFAALDRQVAEPDRLELLALLDCSAPKAMDTALLRITRRILAAVQPALRQEGAAAVELAQEYLEFIARELDLLEPAGWFQ